MFSFKKKKKKLTLEQIHSLYLLLLPYIPEKEEALLIDQVDKMLESMPSEVFISAIEIMYEDVKYDSPIKVAVLFIDGLKRNNFFDYASFVENLVKNG